MKKLFSLLISLYLLAGCSMPSGPHAPSEYVTAYHDDKNGVTCWILLVGTVGGISCLPDKELVIR